MGVSIGTKRFDIIMSYDSFLRFRKEVAKAISEEFGNKYCEYIEESFKAELFFSELSLKKLDEAFNKYLETAGVDDDVVDFLFLPDSVGKINYKTARKIRDLCRKSESKICFGYIYNRVDMSGMAEMFNDAVKHRCNVTWC